MAAGRVRCLFGGTAGLGVVRLAYPALHSPAQVNQGPALMPFAFTTVDVRPAPAAPQPLLVDANISLDAVAGHLNGGSAFLIRPGQVVEDLGRPTLNSVLACGARVGDELCILGPPILSAPRLRTEAPPQLVLSRCGDRTST
ncbi:MAG: hypothetical protein IPK16_01630 [Anaerolineales bacterium]|nr:hypothetical protein [Anaerolineales bacterium]